MSTTLLPNGMQCFSDADGPLGNGFVYMYLPGTTTPKDTWQDANQATLNSNPIELDENGCALIYGVGTYRQLVYDADGNQIWDALTTDTSAFNSVFWADTAGGTPNVITVTYPGFSGLDGQVINFLALNTNTGSATLNPSGFGAAEIVKDTSGGPTNLTGGEITATNLVSVVYDATANVYHLLNPAIASASGSSQALPGVRDLIIQVLSNSQVQVVFAQAVMQDPSGLIIKRNGGTFTADITTGTVTSTANGMDGEAPVANEWLYVWLIDNGGGAAVLFSRVTGNGLSCVLPGGYSFKHRIGFVRVDAAVHMLRTLQRQDDAQYIVISGTNTAAYPIAASGAAGNPATPTYVTVTLSTIVPINATKVNGTVGSSAGGTAIVSSGVDQGAQNSATNPPDVSISTAGFGSTQFELVLQGSQQIVWASTAAGNFLAIRGWRDAI